MSGRVEIGGVARAHGIRGEVVIVTHDPESDTLAVVDTVYVAGTPKKIVEARDTQKGWLVQLEGVATRNDAEALRGKVVEVDRDQLELGDDDILLADLVGCAVRKVDGTPWGTISEVIAGELQDLLVIHEGEIERMLPLVDEFVTSIDIAAKLVTVDPPEGLPEGKR